MELLQDILCRVLAQERIHISFPDLAVQDVKQIVEAECYKALQEIRAVLDDDSLEDSECFERIERIVSIFEAHGSNGGSRHDFG